MFHLRPITARDRSEVAELVCLSTNHWYQTRLGTKVFHAGPESTAVFFDVTRNWTRAAPSLPNIRRRDCWSGRVSTIPARPTSPWGS